MDLGESTMRGTGTENGEWEASSPAGEWTVPGDCAGAAVVSEELSMEVQYCRLLLRSVN